MMYVAAPKRDVFRLPLINSVEINRIFSPLFPMIPFLLALGLLGAALEGIGIGLVIPLITAMVGVAEGRAPGGGSALFQRLSDWLPSEDRAFFLVGGMVLLIVAKNAVIYANGLLCGWIYGRTSFDIRSRLADRLTRLELPFVTGQKPGRLLHILSNESWRAADAIQASIALMIACVASVILSAFLLLLSWRMTIAVIAGLILLQFVHGTVSNTLRSRSHHLSSANSALAAHMLHLIQAARLIRIFSAERTEQAALDQVSNRVRRAVFAMDARKALLPPVMEVMQTGLFLSIVVLAWANGLSFAVIAAFLVLLYRLQPQLRALQSSISQLRGWTGSIDEVSWLLGQVDQPQDGASRHFAGLGSEIRLEDVSLRYGPSRSEAALSHVSLDIRAGRSTAIVGKSGSGKSSLADILARFREPTEGMVRIDGVPLPDIARDGWRARTAVASPELELIDGTVEENIRYGAPGVDIDAVVHAARLADADAFIRALPDGYASPVGYRGVLLSAGQRQRIALARALLRDPDVLILDEATNALDALSEVAVIGTLRARAGRGTTIVISHHLAAISFCDDLIMLDAGRVVAAGPLSLLSPVSMESFLGSDTSQPAARVATPAAQAGETQ
jgi:ABC-type multidrug transport system fused ATPase/permease subunit